MIAVEERRVLLTANVAAVMAKSRLSSCRGRMHEELVAGSDCFAFFFFWMRCGTAGW